MIKIYLIVVLSLTSLSILAAETVTLKKGQTISDVLYEKKLEVGATTNLYGRDSLVKKTLQMNPELKSPKLLKPGTVVALPEELVRRQDPESVSEPEAVAETIEAPVVPEEPTHPSTYTFKVGYMPAVFDSNETTEDGELSATPYFNPIGLYASADWKKSLHQVLGEIRLFGPKSTPDLGPMMDLSLTYQAHIGSWFSVGPIATGSNWEGYALDVQNALVSDENVFTKRNMKAVFGGARACISTFCFDYQKALSVNFENSSELRKTSGDGSGDLISASYSWKFYETWSLVPRFEKRKLEDGDKAVKSELTSYSLGILKEF